MHKDPTRILITREEIAARVKELGARISEDYLGKVPLVISVLKGSVIFLADLIRAINIDTEIDFMVVSSFGSGIVSSGAVRIIKDLEISIENRDVLIVEDILDSGTTLAYLTELLAARKPASLRIVTLLDKTSQRRAAISPDYTGFIIPDEFVVGYGLDYDEHYRNLPDIRLLEV